MRKVENTKGITLVALVITVIVLLILAGTAVSIAINSGDIFSKASTAKAEYNNKVAEEEKAISEILEMVDDRINPEKQAMKILVNSGSNGLATLKIKGEYPSIRLDWGDGNIITWDDIAPVSTGKNDEIIQSSYKVASKDGFKISPGVPYKVYQFQHQYATNNKEYTITITGIRDLQISSDEIIKILQFGQMELEYVGFIECINLTYIELPTSRSFKNIPNFRILFGGCTSITSIPEDLFKYCTNVESFEKTFAGCTSITSIPSGLFDNCSNVESFEETFYGCTSLTGQALPLWERMENGATHDYVPAYTNETLTRGPEGYECYFGCTGLTNYASIPEYWKQGK